MGLAVWCEDEAGPFQTVPHPGGSWRPEGRPATQPHEYVRAGTAKILTLFHPATGRVSLRPATSGTNTVLHGWLKEVLGQIVAALPARAAPLDPAANRALWQAWQDGLAVRFSLPADLPPLRILLVWDVQLLRLVLRFLAHEDVERDGETDEVDGDGLTGSGGLRERRRYNSGKQSAENPTLP